MAKESLPKMDTAHHYLLESHHGTTPIEWLGSKSIRVDLSHSDRIRSALVQRPYWLEIDERDNRVLVIVDGCLLPESFSHNGEIVQSIPLCELSTKAQQVRSPKPYYEGMVDLPFVPRQHYFDKRTGEVQVNITRYFLLLPVKTNAVFVRPRDLKSLGPMYTFIEVDIENGKPVVRWRNTSW